MNKTTLLTGLVMLVLGLGIGYTFGNNDGSRAGDHFMADGSMIRGSMGMQGMMDEMMVGIKGKSGDDFDRAFMEEMIIHHEGAVSMAHEALRGSKHAEIRQMAQDIISAQTKEIQMMNDWMRTWYGE